VLNSWVVMIMSWYTLYFDSRLLVLICLLACLPSRLSLFWEIFCAFICSLSIFCLRLVSTCLIWSCQDSILKIPTQSLQALVIHSLFIHGPTRLQKYFLLMPVFNLSKLILGWLQETPIDFVVFGWFFQE